tara:strand:- start:146 stop:559 length:414 start_codon:yes stop_codon:yes gene_type:complete
MANRDIKNNIKQDVIFHSKITSDTISNCSTLDMQGYNAGLMVSLCATTYGDGTYSLAFEDSTDGVTFAAIALDKVLGKYSDTITNKNSIGNLPTIGCFSTNRYIRVLITSTGTSAPEGCNIVVMASRKGDKLPIQTV